MKGNTDILVSICCITYNQISSIRQCIDGFLMQKTNFKYEIIIHDDCSTDGTTEVIREYANNYPNVIVPIFQTVNQYQNGNKRILASFVYPKVNGKYIALCEGDDYWTDSMKLQRQVDYLETHPICTMTCNRTRLFSEKQNKYVGEQYCRASDGELSAEDIINRTGLYIPTCSIIYRKEISDNIPDYWKECAVGDYPLQIMCAMKGSVYYFDDVMSVYRIENTSSWMGKQKWGSVSIERLKVIYSRVLMLNGFGSDYPYFRKVFERKVADEINRNIPYWRSSYKDKKIYLDYFSNEIKNYDLRCKLEYRLFILRLPLIRRIYTNLFLKKYQQLKIMY